MKFERTKNATRNIAFGVIVKIYSMAVPFLMRTLMIYFMGVQYLGLNSLFASVLQVLNLAELGVGSAMVYGMYKPIAEDDTEKICALMRLYRTYYRIIGLVILVLGCAIIPLLPHLIEGDLPADVNLYVLYALNLGTTVFSYWLFAYRNCLLSAYQRNDISSKISLAITTVQYGLQCVVILVLKNYYIYVIVAFVLQIVSNLVTALITKKMFPEYKPSGTLNKDEVKVINKHIRDIFTAKLGGVITYSFDTIVISAFMGLTTLAIYQNYYFLLTAIASFFDIIIVSCTSIIGNSLTVESEEKNVKDFKTISLMYFWLAGFCCSCFLCLFQPFMKVWVGETLMFENKIIPFFCLYFISILSVKFFSLYKTAAGVWHEDRFRPLVAAIVNLVLNLIFVQFWGIYGVLLSTCIGELIVSTPWLIHNIFTAIFDKQYKNSYILNFLIYLVLIVVVSALTYLACYFIRLQNDWAILFTRIGICIIVPNILFLVAFIRKAEFKNSLGLLNKITKGKVKFLRKY